MNPVSTQLEISAASIRLAGYVMESQLRVAQVFGKAALAANPFSVPSSVRKPAPTKVHSKSADAIKPKKTAKASVKAVKPATPMPKKNDKVVAAAPVKAPKVTPIEKPKVEAKKVAQPTPSVKAKPAAPKTKAVAKPAPKLSDAKKPAAKPEQKAVKTAEFRSQASREADAGRAKSTNTSHDTPPNVAATSPKQSAADKVQKPVGESAKSARAPSAPPAMPKRDKVASKD